MDFFDNAKQYKSFQQIPNFMKTYEIIVDVVDEPGNENIGIYQRMREYKKGAKSYLMKKVRKKY